MTNNNQKFTTAKIYRYFIYVLPAILLFSYYPLIHFGATESMNLEISLPLIWLVLFDLLSLVLLIKNQKLSQIPKKWPWLLLPIFLTLSIFWSINFLRGLLTIGIIWLLYLAIFSFCCFKDYFKVASFTKNIFKSLFVSALVICAWCYLQCILDLAGVTPNLMCDGCTYKMFGFPHPNGFTIEPQFMGNLLLAPTIFAGYFAFNNRKYYLLFFIFSATLFLTFSRGAIYSFIIATLFMTIAELLNHKKWQTLFIWPVVILAFLFTLNLQGIMAQVSKTDDTYGAGMSKAINHLSLGLIDFSKSTTPVDNEKSASPKPPKETSAYDGYVEESTNVRLKLSDSVIKVWRQNPANVFFGVGLGGAGEAIYLNNYSSSPKEIIQNQYASLLLEVGLVGIILLILTVVLVFKVVIKNPLWLPITTLIIAYLVSLLFFSGLPNALHIYLLPAIFLYGKKPSRKS